MIVIAFSLEPNDADGGAHNRWDVPDEETAPEGTVAVVISVESRVRITTDGSDPAQRGLLLREGTHVIPIAGGKTLRASTANGPASISILWLRLREGGVESA
jgi:hypothetical protein